jgi:hypothetical protein
MTKIPTLEVSQSVKESSALRENQRINTKRSRDIPQPVPSQMNSDQALPSHLFKNQSNVAPTVSA